MISMATYYSWHVHLCSLPRLHTACGGKVLFPQKMHGLIFICVLMNESVNAAGQDIAP